MKFYIKQKEYEKQGIRITQKFNVVVSKLKVLLKPCNTKWYYMAFIIHKNVSHPLKRVGSYINVLPTESWNYGSIPLK